MVIETAQLKGAPVKLATGNRVAAIDETIFDGEQARLVGWQVAKSGVVKRFSGLLIDDALSITRGGVIIDNESVLQKDLKELDQVRAKWGKVLGVRARTESGKNLGKVYDVLIEEETGYVVRFYLRQLLQERIIPRRYLAAVTPKAIVFQDVVDAPVFDQLAATDASPAL